MTRTREGGGGGKRQVTTPVLVDYESVDGDWMEVSTSRHTNQTKEHKANRTSFANIKAQGTSHSNEMPPAGGQKKVLERMFKTAPLDGHMRDNIIVEIRNVNRVPFKGSLHYKEAKYGIFRNCLDMDPTAIPQSIDSALLLGTTQSSSTSSSTKSSTYRVKNAKSMASDHLIGMKMNE